MRDNSIPADGGNVATLVEIWLSRLELIGLLDVLRDILDKDL